MMEADESDDHLCIRCKDTIFGIENYLNHRKICTIQKPPTPKPLEVSTPHHYSDNFNFPEAHDISFNYDDEHDVQNTSNPINKSSEYDIDVEADLFFSFLELQSSKTPTSKSTTNRMMTRKATAALLTTTHHEDDWMEPSSLIKAVNHISGAKKVENPFKYYQQDSPEPESDESSEDEEDDNAPPQNFTGGKWKPQSFADWTNDQESMDSPSPSYTKGKWIPGTKITKLEYNQEKISEEVAVNREVFWCGICSRNLSNRSVYEQHLKSKLHKNRLTTRNELEEAAETLPTSSNELSKHVKERMEKLQSMETLEEKRQLLMEMPDEDFADQLDKSFEDTDEVATKRYRSCTKITCELCNIKLSNHHFGNHLISMYHYRNMLKKPDQSFATILNNIHKIVVISPFQCGMCKFYFNHQEDLLTHFKSKEHWEVLEENRGSFFCSHCEFKCILNTSMVEHLTSPEHQKVVSVIHRSKPIIIKRLLPIICKNCNQDFALNVELLQHLQVCSPVETKFQFSGVMPSAFVCSTCKKSFQCAVSLQKHHLEVHELTVFYCSICELTFESSTEAKQHRRTSKHKANAQKFRGIVQKPKVCKVCKLVFDNLDGFKQHMFREHPEYTSNCPLCGLKFAISQDLSRHVRDKKCQFFSSSPSNTSLETSSIQETQYSPKDEETEIFSSSKDIMDISLNDNNLEFILAETTVETDVTNLDDTKDDWKCTICLFSSPSHAEYLYHTVLHQSPNQKSSVKISCPYCPDKSFRKQSLRDHLKSHTNERNFTCKLCPMSFTRKANLKNHVANIHKSKEFGVINLCDEGEAQEEQGDDEAELTAQDQPQYIKTQSVVTTPTLPNNTKKQYICKVPGCELEGKTILRPRSHKQSHIGLDYFCTVCDYKTKSISHLTRHMLTHTKTKPFNCPYCNYSCNNSENLRKHIIKTSKHAGRFIYECVDCAEKDVFKTNFTKEFQTHMLESHPGIDRRDILIHLE